MNIETSTRLAAASLSFGLGATMLTGCSASYDGWTGCDQAMLTPGASEPRAAMNQSIKGHNEGGTQLNDGSMQYAKGALRTIRDSLDTIHDSAYGTKHYVAPQAGDTIPYCVSETGEISFDLGGMFLVDDQTYSLQQKQWRKSTAASAAE